MGKIGAAIRSRQLRHEVSWCTLRRVLLSATSLHSFVGGLLGVSIELVFSTWRDADPPCPLSGLVEPLPPESPASDISWSLTHRETVRPWEPKAQPGGFQKTSRSAPGFRALSLAGLVLLPVSTFGPEPPFCLSGEGGASVRPRDAFHRVMFHRVAPTTESAVSFGLNKSRKLRTPFRLLSTTACVRQVRRFPSG